MVTKNAIDKALDLREPLAKAAHALEGDNADAVRAAVMAVLKALDHVEDAIQTNERLVRP